MSKTVAHLSPFEAYQKVRKGSIPTTKKHKIKKKYNRKDKFKQKLEEE